LLSPSSTSTTISYHSLTNDDGRIADWSSDTDVSTLLSTFQNTEGEMLWVCRFETRQFFESKSIKPFFPEVEIRFLTEGYKGRASEGAKAHWHVPLLLGPYSYTTYRGS